MANIMVTKRCNLSCPYCFANDYTGDGSAQSSDIEQETFKEILDFIMLDKTAKAVGIIGGEPTVHREFDKILTVLENEKSLEKVTIYTNGILLGKYADMLKSPKFRLLINCNNIEPGSALYDSFFSSLDAVYGVMKERITPGVNFYRPDFDYSFILRLLREYPFKKLRVSISVPNSGFDYRPLDYFSAVKENIFEFFERLREIGTIPFFDCNIFPDCLVDFSEMMKFSEWGEENPFLSVKAKPTNCLPVIDILPDKSAIRCFGLGDETRVSIDDFANITDLRNFYIRTIDAFAVNTYYDARCKDCYKFKAARCSGGCLIYKLDKIKAARRAVEENFCTP